MLQPPVTQSQLFDALIRAYEVSTKEKPSLVAIANDVCEQTPAVVTETGGFRSLRILLAEDNPVNQRVAVAMLQKLGHRVDIANHGQEAVEKWQTGEYDLVLMDVQMPVMDGFSATAEIRRREEALGRPRSLIIAMTANALEGDREKCLAAGMDDYLSKPVTRERIDAVVKKWFPAEPASGPSAAATAPQATDSEGPPALDRSVLDAATGGDDELAAEILALFAKTLPGILAKIDAAVAQGSLPALKAAAHELKGSSANVGAVALSRWAAELELAAQRGPVPAELLEKKELLVAAFYAATQSGG